MDAYDHFYIYSYFFGLTFLPCLALLYNRKQLNPRHLVKLSYIFLSSACICFLYQLITQADSTSFIELLAGRAQTKLEGNENKSIINPIVVGFFGANLSLFILGKVIVTRKIGILNIILNLMLFIVGIALLFLGASRGPFIFFVSLLVVTIFYHIKYERKNFIFFRRMFFLTISIIVGFKIYILPIIEKADIFLLQRLIKFSENLNTGKKEIRNYAFESAFNDFLDSPVIGKQFVGTYDNFYPHNIPLEVLMSTGLVGATFFLLALIALLKSSYLLWARKTDQYKFPLFLVGLSSILLGLTSGSIMSHPDFWIFLMLLIILPKTDLKKSELQLANYS